MKYRLKQLIIAAVLIATAIVLIWGVYWLIICATPKQQIITMGILFAILAYGIAGDIMKRG